MEERLMHGWLSALPRGWPQCCGALHPAPHPTRLEALCDTDLATAHTVTQCTRDAERMEYPHCRARLLRMAAEDQGHVTWQRDTLLARGGTIPTRACTPTGFVKLLRLRRASGKRVPLPGPTHPLGSPLRARNFGPTLESLLHLVAVCRC
jgi:hypothetical protein